MYEPILIWHPSVHRRVRERLYYFLVSVEKFFSSEFEEWFISEIVSNLKLGSYCLYVIYGPFDVLIRIWINPSSVPEFTNRLADKAKAVLPFAVDEQLLNWCFPKKSLETDIKAMECVKKESILAVHQGDEKAREEFLKTGLLVQVPTFPSEKSIKFYVALNQPSISDRDALEHLLENIKKILVKNKKIENQSLYVGSGFAWVLAKATTRNVHNIRSLVECLAKEVAPFASFTTTYIVITNKPIENDGIGSGSLGALDAWDPAVDAWLPALYTELPPGSTLKVEMEQFLRDYLVNFSLVEEDENQLKNFFNSVIKGNKDWSVAFSILLFSRMEELLRHNLGRFMGSLYGSSNVGRKLSDFGIKTKIKDMALQEINESYYKVVRDRFPKRAADLLPKNPDKIEKTRNGIAHGWKNPVESWKDVGESLFEIIIKGRNLLSFTHNQIRKKS